VHSRLSSEKKCWMPLISGNVCTVVQGAWKLKLTLQLGLMYSNYSSSVACSLFTREKKTGKIASYNESHKLCH